MACALAPHTLFPFLTALWTEARGSRFQDLQVGKVRRFNLKGVCRIWKAEEKDCIVQQAGKQGYSFFLQMMMMDMQSFMCL